MLEPRWRWACPAELETSQVGVVLGGGQGRCWRWGLASSPPGKAVGPSAQAVFGDPLGGVTSRAGQGQAIETSDREVLVPPERPPLQPTTGATRHPCMEEGAKKRLGVQHGGRLQGGGEACALPSSTGP